MCLICHSNQNTLISLPIVFFLFQFLNCKSHIVKAEKCRNLRIEIPRLSNLISLTF
ncbi:hypothetical protein MANES_02G036775v8 [Manihot esculenta]|uniref:Uncharacterized protein n=1 Tax=Manihot esculenta TaxID=3983 RepID=A0ACB7I2X2_MANES|nr:hypothetical protein MANES_02G036775v8 [Manihot esculenta]